MAAAFAIGTIALLVIVDRTVHRYASEVADDSVAAEIAILVDEDRVAGRAQSIKSVVRRENAVREHDLRYGFIDPGGRRVAGSLPASAAQLGWHDIVVDDENPDHRGALGKASLRAFGVRLGDGAILVVASDTSDLDELRQRLRRSSVLIGLGITLVALTGGIAAGTIFLQRLDNVNRSVGHIMQGNFTERLPTIGISPELDQLSANLNRMLDRIEVLLEGMRQVSTDIAHDLRTPLTRLRYRLEMLKVSAPDTIEMQIDGAISQTDEILRIFKTLLRISALETGSAAHRLIEANLSACLKQLIETYQPVAEDAGHILTGVIEPGVHCTADFDMLVQAVTNLIENAILHTAVGSRIKVILSSRDHGILIAVEDNGGGIPAAEREQVLRRFYRLDSSRGSPGAGLGLALVAAVAALHDATLRLADNDPGLRVELFLPLDSNRS